MRKLNRQIHLWLGLPSAAVFLVVAVTGAILVFEKDLDRALHPELWRTETGAAALPLDTLLARAQAAAPGHTLKEVRLTAGAGQPTEFRFDKGPHVRLDPATGRVLGTRARGDSFFGIVERIHTSLVLGKVGKWVVAGSAVILVVLLATGLVLWWPKQWRMLTNAVSLALHRRGRAFHFNLHNTLGFWSALPLGAIAVTGAIMGIKPLSDALRGHHGKPRPPAAASDGALAPARVDAIFAVAAGIFPGWRELRLHAPRAQHTYGHKAEDRAAPTTMEESEEKPEPAQLVWRIEAVAGDTAHEHARSIAWLDPRTAGVLRIDRFQNLPLGARLRALARPLHDGSIFGRPSQVVALLSVLMVPVLSVTGVALWWLRRRATQAQKKCTALGVRTPSIPYRSRPAATTPASPQARETLDAWALPEARSGSADG
jgi:uncharacterized iron-regulated membrane protein